MSEGILVRVPQPTKISRKGDTLRADVLDRKAWICGYALINEERRSIKYEYSSLNQHHPHVGPDASHLAEMNPGGLDLFFIDACSQHVLTAVQVKPMRGGVIHDSSHGVGRRVDEAVPMEKAETPLASFLRRFRRRVDESAVISIGLPPEQSSGPPLPFTPSASLARFVVARARQTNVADSSTNEEELTRLACEQIKEAVVGLFHSMSESIKRSDSLSEYIIGSAGKFDEAVVKALLFRVSVGFYESVGFAAELYEEVRRAAMDGALFGPTWRLAPRSDDNLMLEVKRDPPPSARSVIRERARVVKYGAKPPI